MIFSHQMFKMNSCKEVLQSVSLLNPSIRSVHWISNQKVMSLASLTTWYSGSLINQCQRKSSCSKSDFEKLDVQQEYAKLNKKRKAKKQWDEEDVNRVLTCIDDPAIIECIITSWLALWLLNWSVMNYFWEKHRNQGNRWIYFRQANSLDSTFLQLD